MRDELCAEGGPFGRSPRLRTLCTSVLSTLNSIIQWCQVDPEKNIGTRTARVHGSAEYVRAVESIFSSSLHRVRGISCASAVELR